MGNVSRLTGHVFLVSFQVLLPCAVCRRFNLCTFYEHAKETSVTWRLACVFHSCEMKNLLVVFTDSRVARKFPAKRHDS